MKLFDDKQVYFIAEMSANHMGSLSHALDIVRAAAEAGADCIKVQTYTPDTMTLYSDAEYFKISGGPWAGYTLYELYKEAALPYDWHAPIKRAAEEAGMDFLSTPFDSGAVDFLDGLGVGAYKIASFELTDIPLLKYTARKGAPILLSTGMAEKSEIAAAVNAIRGEGNGRIVLLKCTSEYPARTRDMNLATITDMMREFDLPCGLSDHSMGHGAAVCAAMLGASVIEKHFCLSRNDKGPDSGFSMEPREFAEMVRAVRLALEMRGGVIYGPSGSEKGNLKFRRSIFAVKDIARGEVFNPENVRIIRPSDGLPPSRYEQLMGKAATREIAYGTPLSEEDVSW